MRSIFILLLLLLAASPAYAALLKVVPGLGAGIGDMEVVKIGGAARDRFHAFLLADYRRQCVRTQKPAAGCDPARPLYAGTRLETAGVSSLPPELLESAGFSQPGTAYFRKGFTIYLVNWPRRIILDSVSAWDD